MPHWTARTSGTAAANGTTTHAIPTPNGASTPAGAFLVVVVGGAVTITTSATGWTSALAPVNSGGLSVFYKTSAAAGEASLSVTHNGSNYPVNYETFEFPSGTTWVAGTSYNSGTATGAWTALNGVSTADFLYAATLRVVVQTSGTMTTTWTGATESVEILTLKAATDGAYLSSAYLEDAATSSWTPSSSSSGTGGITGSGDWQRVWFGLNVPAAANTGVLSAQAPTAQGSVTGQVTVSGVLSAQAPTAQGSASGQLLVPGTLTAQGPTAQGSISGTVIGQTLTGSISGAVPVLRGAFSVLPKTASRLNTIGVRAEQRILRPEKGVAMSLKKAPAALLPFGFDYSDWLDDGETVVSATWTAAPDNVDTVMAVASAEVIGNVVQAWLQGGTPGTWYVFRVLVTTSLGKIDERAIHVACEEP